MMTRLIGTLAAAAALVATPVAASAASVNPAASLSVAPARAGSSSAHKSDLAGGGVIYAIIILAGIAAVAVVGATNNDNPRSP